MMGPGLPDEKLDAQYAVNAVRQALALGPCSSRDLRTRTKLSDLDIAKAVHELVEAGEVVYRGGPASDMLELAQTPQERAADTLQQYAELVQLATGDPRKHLPSVMPFAVHAIATQLADIASELRKVRCIIEHDEREGGIQ